MPNPVNARKGEQWDICQACGRLFPNGELSWQKGVKKCAKCVDDLEVEKRPAIIARLLESPVQEAEGADLRNVDEAFFLGLEEYDV